MDGLRVDADRSTLSCEQSVAADVDDERNSSTAYKQLKPGPGKTPQQVQSSQRDRIHRAMIELAADRGFEHVTVRQLTRKAGVSSRAFYGQFSNREECLASSVETIGRALLLRAARS